MASRRKFTPEYKAEAVALVIDSGRSVPEVAQSLGVHENTLSNWVNKAKERGEVPEKPVTLSERAELVRLRKDNTQLQMDNAFLKKAAAWFASENK
jgi:transposase